MHVKNLIKNPGELQGQEEAGCTQQMNELFTGSTTLKLVNVLNKPPLKLLLKPGARWPHKITSVWMYACVCVSVYLSAPEGMNN